MLSEPVGSQALVARVTEGGVADATFGPGGVQLIDVPGSASEDAKTVRVLAAGTILVGGRSSGGAFLAELDSEGKPVAGFGTAGIAVRPVGILGSEINDLAVLADGRIVAVGSVNTAERESALFVARYTAGGDPDASFGEGGVFVADPTDKDDEGETLAVLPDGRILAAGERGGDSTDSGDTWLVRLTAKGEPDTSFGPGGELASSGALGADSAEGLALQADGKAVTAGEAYEGAATGGFKLLFGRFAEGEEPPATPIGGTDTPPQEEPTFRCKAASRRSSAPREPTASSALPRPT